MKNSKKCEKVAELIPLYLSGELQREAHKSDLELLESHLLGCLRCSKELETAREVSSFLESEKLESGVKISIPNEVERNFIPNLYRKIALDAINSANSANSASDWSAMISDRLSLLSLKPPLWASGVIAACSLLIGILIGSYNVDRFDIDKSVKINELDSIALKASPSENKLDSNEGDNFNFSSMSSELNYDNYERNLGGISFSFTPVIKSPQDENAFEQLRSANFFHYVLKDYRRALSEYKNLSDRYSGSQVAQEARKQIKKLQAVRELSSL